MMEPGESIEDYVARSIAAAVEDIKVTDIQQLPLAALRRWNEDQMSDEAVGSANVTEGVAFVGEMRMCARATAPQGWLLCQGQTLSRTQYAALFNAIGTTYAVGGEAATDFRLPDLRGRTPIGSGTGTGLTARTLGSRVGGENLAAADLPSHTHTGTTATAGAHAHNPNVGGSFLGNGGASSANITTGGGGYTTFAPTDTHPGHQHTITTNGGDGIGTGNGSRMPPSQAVNFVIKY